MEDQPKVTPPLQKQPIRLLDAFKPSDSPHREAEFEDAIRETRERVNELILTITALEKRLETSEAALMVTIRKFENHSHSQLGIAVVPVGTR